MKWEKPSFEELPLNMEVTGYIKTDQNHIELSF